MPCVGQPPFLHGAVHTHTQEESVSMPCVGRPPFLLNEIIVYRLGGGVCQCPVSGDLHFYLSQSSFVKPMMCCVNALCRAISISTGHLNAIMVLGKEGVNALCRATSISTYQKILVKCVEI